MAAHTPIDLDVDGRYKAVGAHYNWPAVASLTSGARLLLRHKPYHTDPDAVVVVRKDNGEELAWISRKNTDDFKGLGTTPATFVWAGRIGHGPRCVVLDAHFS